MESLNLNENSKCCHDNTWNKISISIKLLKLSKIKAKIKITKTPKTSKKKKKIQNINKYDNTI